MKIFLSSFFIISGIFNGVSAQNRSVNFENIPFSDLKEKANKNNKLIFLDFSPVWCKPCKIMDKQVFTNDSVADFFNNHFISKTITDIDTLEGKQISDKYNITVFPTFLFFDGDSLVHQGCSYKNPKNIIELGSNALVPAKQLYSSVNLYYKGKKDVTYTAKLLDDLENACVYNKIQNIMDDYLAEKKDQELYTQSAWQIIKHASGTMSSSDFSSKACKFILKNYDTLLITRSDSEINQKINTILIDAVAKIIQDTIIKTKEDRIIEFKNSIAQISPTNQKLFSSVVDLFFYEYPYTNSKYLAAANSGVVEKIYWNEPWVLNNCAWQFYEHVNDKAKLQKAVQWIKRSIQLDNNSTNNNTYSHLLYKLSRVKEAINIEELAVALAKKSNEPNLKDYENELEKFKQKK